MLLSLYEDVQKGPLGSLMPAYIATRALKPRDGAPDQSAFNPA